MFRRFSEPASEVLVLAQQRARSLKHNEFGTEHIVLGLLLEPRGHAGRALEALGISAEVVDDAIRRIVGTGEEVPPDPVRPSARARRVLELAFREADESDRDGIDTEHILLALVGGEDSVAVRVLLELGAGPDAIRTAVLRQLAMPGAAAHASEGRPVAVGPELYPHAATEDAVELGWRQRGILLAALGAAVLSRSAFSAERTGVNDPLAMQLLCVIALNDSPAFDPGTDTESVDVPLACTPEEIDAASALLLHAGLVVETITYDDERLLRITDAGVTQLHDWLDRATPLFGRWPPEHPGVDDATG